MNAATLAPDLPLLILGCSATKLPVEDRLARIPFPQFYDGPLWRDLRASGFPLGNVAALSSAYGFLEPWWTVQPYDKLMTPELCAVYSRRPGRSYSIGRRTFVEPDAPTYSVRRLAELAKACPSTFVVAGPLYRPIAAAAVEFFPELAGRVTFAEGSFLKLRKALGTFLRAHAPVTTREAA